VNFITYLEPPYLLDYNYIVVPLPTGFFLSAYLNGEGVQEFITKCCEKGFLGFYIKIDFFCNCKNNIVEVIIMIKNLVRGLLIPNCFL
jgi:hypothetical protein